MLDRGPPPGFIGSFKKSGICKTNQHELNKYELGPYYKKRDFKKKIANMYVPVLESHMEEQKGAFPVFKVSQTAFDAMIKKASSSSSV